MIVLLFASAFVAVSVFLWHKYEAEIEREEQLNKTSLQLQRQELILQQRENLLQEREKNLSFQAALLDQKSQSNAGAVARLQQEESRFSAQARQIKVEDEIVQRMKEFSDFGVDLSQFPYCDDAQGVRRYTAAQAKYNEIRTLLIANNLVTKYDGFFGSGTIVLRSNNCVPRR